MPRNILPWVLLATAVVVALTVLRSPASQVAVPAPSSVVSAAPLPSGPAPTGRTYNDPPMDETETRDVHLKVGHEACEEGAKRINELEGLASTDPKGIRVIGACLQHGNVAWYKCVIQAKTRLEAGTCNRRFLNGPAAP